MLTNYYAGRGEEEGGGVKQILHNIFLFDILIFLNA